MITPFQVSTWWSTPQEILAAIFALVPADDLAVYSETFHHTLPSNISHPLQARLEKAHLAVTNRFCKPLQMEMYRLTPSFYDKEKLEYVKPKNIRTLMKHKPHTIVTLSYFIWNVINIQELMDLAGSLPTEGIRYNIEMEFETGIQHIVDLSMVIDRFAAAFGDLLVSLVITNYTGDLQLDMTRLTLLEILWLMNTNVTFVSLFEKNDRLRTLVLHPNCNGFSGNNPVVIDKGLPLGITSLRLGQLVVVDPLPLYPVPQHVTDLAVMTVRDTTGFYIPSLIEKSPTQKNLFVYQSALSECSGHANYKHIQNLMAKEQHITCLGLTSIKNEDGVWDFSLKLTLQLLKISKCSVLRLELPPNLTSLDVSNNNIADLQEIVLRQVPEHLTSLNLLDNPGDWSAVARVRFPSSLVELKLMNTNVGDYLPRFEFPNTIERLSLEVNQIHLVQNVRFPNGPKLNLGLGCNHVSRIDGPFVPPNTHTIHLTENRLRGPLDLSQDREGVPIQVEVLYLNSTSILSLCDIRLPPVVRILNFDQCKITRLENVEFPASIEEFSMCGCELAIIRNVTFAEGSRLRSFRISQNRVDEENFRRLRLPDKLRVLTMGSNCIRHLPHDVFDAYPRLRYVNLSSNKLKKAHFQLPNTLRALDLSFNKIILLKLVFPKNLHDTELALLNLLLNLLLALTPEMIGHNVNGVSHKKLFEVDVSENKFRTDQLLGLYPESLASMVVGGSGLQDRYGYEIGTNILGEGYCLGKRIDMPYL